MKILAGIGLLSSRLVSLGDVPIIKAPFLPYDPRCDKAPPIKAHKPKRKKK